MTKEEGQVYLAHLYSFNIYRQVHVHGGQKGLSVNQQLADSARLAAQWTPGILLSLPPSLPSVGFADSCWAPGCLQEDLNVGPHAFLACTLLTESSP